MTTAALDDPAPPAAPVFRPPPPDFADWLSPMLVKELRQGVRTRVFVLMFILLQVFMLIDLTLSVLVASEGADANSGTVFFWLMISVPTLLILPINGLGAIGNEIRANTLELIFLTRLTAFRIVVGKWFALFVQALLLVCAVLPYLVLRYFMGGVNLAVELFTLGMILAGSALLIALSVGASAFPTRLVRPLAAVGGFFMLSFGTNFFGLFFYRGGGPGLPGVWETLVAAGCAAIVLLLLLEIGAGRIAPPAENHPGVLRLLGVGALLLAVVGGWLFAHPEPLTGTTAALALLVCVIAINEQPRWIPSIYRPFAVRGWAGRMVGRLFYPGWHTGVLFLLAMFAAFGGLMAHQRMLTRDAQWTHFAVVAGVLLFPVAVVRAFFPKTQRPVAFFCVIQIVSLTVYLLCTVCDEALRTSTRIAAGFLPLGALFLSLGGYDPKVKDWTFIGSITSLVSLAVLLILGLRAMRQTREMERESLQMPAPPSTRAPAADEAVAAPPPDAPLA